jgi:two-component system nitrogen regulation sensor histidine kinase GlnL
MIRVSFSVDKMLRIDSLNMDSKMPMGEGQGGVLGMQYDELFPRISQGQVDAVSEVVGSGRARFLRGYQIPCFCGSMYADISILPRKGKTGDLTGAVVSAELYSDCAISRELAETQLLINIGKNAASLAHSMRNPLNTLKGAAYFLKQRYAGDQTVVEFANIAEEEISRLDDLIARFLGAASAEDDSREIQTDVNSLLKKLEVLVSLQARASNVKCTYEYADNAPPVAISSFQLEQAVLNVISNAIEAMPTGGSLRLKTRFVSSSKEEFLIIEISDTGPGMAPAGIEEMTLPANREGRGFGLYITREILKRHGGHLEIVSDAERGTTVFLWIRVDGGGRDESQCERERIDRGR